MAGFQGLPLKPPQPPPLRLLLLSMKMPPFPQHHSAGTAFTVKSVWLEIEYGEEVDTEMSWGDRREGATEWGLEAGEVDDKMETMTFAELRAVILWSDGLQIDLLMSSKTTPPSLEELVLNFDLW